MLKFFFHRDSKFVRACEAAGLAGFIWILFSGWFWAQPFVTHLFFVLYLLGYIFIRFCANYNWYRRFNPQPTNPGISLHFKKALVPTSYIIALTNILILLHVTVVVIYFAAFLLFLIFHLNVILLYFHWKDDDETPPNHFSG